LGKRIAQLEALCERRLFERSTRHMTLTAEGEALLPHARRLLQVAHDCRSAGRGEGGAAPLKLVIGTRYELGLSWVLPLLPSLAKALPHLSIDLYFGSGPDLEERVRRFEIPCAITSRVFTDPVFDALRLRREDYVFVGAPQLLRRNPLIEPNDAAEHTVIDVHREQPLLRYLRNAREAPARLSFRRARVMGSIAAIRALLHAEEGVAVLPLYLVAEDLKAGRLQRIFPELELACDHFNLIFRADDPRLALYTEIADLLRAAPLH
jgi:DNA-binding transcriptional LysR family regulator